MSTTTASKMANDTEAQQTSPPSCSSRNIELENVAQIPRVMSSRVERGCFTLPNMPKIFHNKKFCFAIWSLVYIGLCGVVTEFPIEIGEKIIICIFAVPTCMVSLSAAAIMFIAVLNSFTIGGALWLLTMLGYVLGCVFIYLECKRENFKSPEDFGRTVLFYWLLILPTLELVLSTLMSLAAWVFCRLERPENI